MQSSIAELTDYRLVHAVRFYRPLTKFAKVMFLHLSVSHSVHRGVCVVAGGHAWLQGGAFMVARGMHGCQGACMVGGAWLGGMHGCREGEQVSLWGGTCMGYDEIWSMSRPYASYWNIFLFFFCDSNLFMWVYGSVHTVWFALHACISVCDVTHEWVLYTHSVRLRCAIPIYT